LASAKRPRPETEERILGYFLRHPEAFDDAEGIVRWRLAEEEVRLRLEEAQRALDALVEAGLLERTMTRSTAPLYRLKQDRPVARPARKRAAPRGGR
jgi:Fe2+ or Zn2+ uptake regulation protein